MSKIKFFSFQLIFLRPGMTMKRNGSLLMSLRKGRSNISFPWKIMLKFIRSCIQSLINSWESSSSFLEKLWPKIKRRNTSRRNPRSLKRRRRRKYPRKNLTPLKERAWKNVLMSWRKWMLVSFNFSLQNFFSYFSELSDHPKISQERSGWFYWGFQLCCTGNKDIDF